MTTLKLETQQSDGGGGGGDVTREYVDQRDAATLDSANGYTDLVASGKQNTLTAGTNITIEDNVISADGITGVSWGDIDGNLADQTDLSSALGDKQDTLTAGANISIDANNEISATDTTYSAGANISIDSNNEISATDTTYTAGANITIDANNEISATDTTYTAGTNVSISSSNVISATDTTYSNFVGTDGATAGSSGLVPGPATTDAGTYLKADGTWGTPPGTTYTAGANIQINGSVISATDTTYSDFTGATSSVAGTPGLVPAPSAGDEGKVLFGDGTWADIVNPSVVPVVNTTTNNTAVNSGQWYNQYSYQVPSDGIYIVSFSQRMTNGSNSYDFNVRVTLNGTEVSSNASGGSTYVNYISPVVTCAVSANAGDTIACQSKGGGSGTFSTNGGRVSIVKVVNTNLSQASGSIITMQTTDPGEGQPLAANNFIAVYSAI